MKALRITPRDLDVLETLGRHRFVSLCQLSALHYGPAGGGARRLRELVERGLAIAVHVPRPIPGHVGRAAYALAPAGQRALRRVRDGPELRALPEHERRSALFLEHTLARSNLYVALELLHSSHALQLLAWRHAPEAMRMGARVVLDDVARRVALVPDAFVAVREGRRNHAFVVEIDMGTVSPERMRVKFAGYRAWWKSGAHAALSGEMPTRVLTLTTTAGRLERLRRAACASDDDRSRLFWFALHEEVDLVRPERLLGPVWLTSDMRDGRRLTLFNERTPI